MNRNAARQRTIWTILMLATGVGCYPAASQPHSPWVRSQSSGKGADEVPIQECHPLQYYVKNPFKLDYGLDFWRQDPKEHTVSTDVNYIGEIGKFKIHDVIHTIDGNFVMKLILVERTLGQFCEIYHVQQGTIIAARSFIVDHDGQRILATRSRISGSGGYYAEAYWVFNPGGPIRLQFNDVATAALQKVLPPQKGVWRGNGLNIEKLCHASSLWPTGGGVYIKFAIVENQVVVVDCRFDPRSLEEGSQLPDCPGLRDH